MPHPNETLNISETLVSEHLENNDSVVPLPVISKNSEKELYSMAYSFYNNGKFQEALDCFLFLVRANADAAKYWIGFAAVHQKLKNYHEAIGAFAVAALLDTKDPQIHMHAADCFFAVNERTQASDALKAAELLATGQEKYHQLLSRIALLRSAWKEQI
jgi:type III secretion system low calcium response chaperone LcrH/SycD